MQPQLYLHITWTTLDRRPMISAAVSEFLQRFLPAEAARHGCSTIALGMVCDHVHLLLSLPSRFDLPRLMQGLKGASSRIIQAEVSTALGLRWARGYQAKTLDPRSIDRVANYVRTQSERHPERAIDQMVSPRH